jgi:GT2 family glycosyltransferase
MINYNNVTVKTIRNFLSKIYYFILFWLIFKFDSNFKRYTINKIYLSKRDLVNTYFSEVLINDLFECFRNGFWNLKIKNLFQLLYMLIRPISSGIGRKWSVRNDYSDVLFSRISNYIELNNAPEINMIKKCNHENLVAVVVPVFNSYLAFKNCYESIINLKHKNIRLYIIDDKSTDVNLIEFLKVLEKEAPIDITIIRNQINLGYTKSINTILQKIKNDFSSFLLLNSDTYLPSESICKLLNQLESNKDFGMISPLTNSSNLSKVIDLEISNNDFSNVEDIDLLCGKLFNSFNCLAPTIDGFCVLISDKVFENCGFFDEIAFPRGYGEENEFSLRAYKRGFKSGIAADTFVYHVGTASFEGSEKEINMSSGIHKLLTLYPNYLKEVNTFKEQTILNTISLLLQKIHNFSGMKSICKVHLIHNFGGGSDRYVKQIIMDDRNSMHIVIMLNQFGDIFLVDIFNNTRDDNKETKISQSLFFFILSKIGHLHFIIHSTINSPRLINELYVKYPDAKKSVEIHDFSLLCPRIFLINHKLEYCGLPEEVHCNECLNSSKNSISSKQNSSIEIYRTERINIINKSDDFVVHSDFSKKIDKYIDSSKIIKIIPESGSSFIPNFSVSTELNSLTRNLLVVGAISTHKGISNIKKVLDLVDSSGIPLVNIYLFGYFHEDKISNSNLIESGQFNTFSEIESFISGVPVHGIYFPSNIPETFSFILSDLIRWPIPKIYYNIGAIGERMKSNTDGISLELDVSSAQVAEILMTLNTSYIIVPT